MHLGGIVESSIPLDCFDDDPELQSSFRVLAWIESQQNGDQSNPGLPEPIEEVLREPVTGSPTQQSEIIYTNLEDKCAEQIIGNNLEDECSEHEDLDSNDPSYIPESDSEFEVENRNTFIVEEVALEEEGIFPLEEAAVDTDSPKTRELKKKRDPTPSPVKKKKRPEKDTPIPIRGLLGEIKNYAKEDCPTMVLSEHNLENVNI